MFELALVFLLAFVTTFAVLPPLIRKLKASGITGKDENKPHAPEVAEMGGITIIIGVVAALLFSIALNTFVFNSSFFSTDSVLAALATLLIMSLVGIYDDLFEMRQWVKALLPLAAAIPLVALKVGVTTLDLPFMGPVNFGIFYVLILVPLGIAVMSNLTNMLAGFNGMEAGMGIIMFAALSVISLSQGNVSMAILSLSMLGALLAFIVFNWYPAKVFPGDIGNLSIGTMLAACVIVGNFESAGAILSIPYVLDFFVKLVNKFPHTPGTYKNGKLYAPEGRVRGLVQLVMKLSNGISERNLVMFFIATELVFALIAIAVYVRF